MQTLHGFAAVVALIGNVANSDSGLAMVHETSNAVGVCYQSRDSFMIPAQVLIEAGNSSFGQDAEPTLTKS